MIVVDTSALIAMLWAEAEAETFAHIIARSGRALIGAPTAFEFLLVVMKRKGAAERAVAEQLLARHPAKVVAWTPALAGLAADSLVRFGGLPASLNYGDCMAYALAKSLDVPLLCKGGDFANTDIRAAA